jgi:two-component system cell cycle response regulator DivK
MGEVSPTGAAELPPLVLLVDGDADTREMYAVFLADSGYRVEQARDGAEALSKTHSALPDIVVADIKLPGMDGVSLCREIRRDGLTARIPVIAVTGYASPNRVEEAKRAGFERLLIKPCLPDLLLAEIRQAIEAARDLSERGRALQAKA